ncbi:HSP20 family protein [Asanoa hainanensis]|uniref:HSP20 family protein n=1 Tax=Asanoa hainanensis TaxID=560556 RepID=A0A239NTV9_9ACTN|nr:HSP20 family protein [Asanoa hainanensis]
MRAELGRLVGSGFGRGALNDVDLEQSDTAFTVTARLPGVAPEEVAIDVDVREVVVRARSARETRAFEYRVALPADVDPDRVDATMDHGLLTVTLPRVVRAGRRTITLGASGALQGRPPSPDDPDAAREMHSPGPS